MPCQNCNSPNVTIQNSNGGTTHGPFKEEYKCGDCGANGWIRGEAGASPTEWSKSGRVFNAV